MLPHETRNDVEARTANTIAALKAENERLGGELEAKQQRLDQYESDPVSLQWKRRAIAAERALSERAGVAKVKPLDLSTILRHAFLSGVVAARNVPAGEACVGPDLWPHYEAYEPGAYTRILSCLTTEPVAPEGELPYMCDACTKGDGGTCRCYPAPEGQQEAVAQFLPTEGGEYNGNVSDIIPDSCTSSSLVFSEGILHVTKDGSGHIVVKEDDFQIETEYDDDGARSDFWITRFPSGEMQSLKDFLNGVTFTRPAEQAVTVQQAAKGGGR